MPFYRPALQFLCEERLRDLSYESPLQSLGLVVLIRWGRNSLHQETAHCILDSAKEVTAALEAATLIDCTE